jgi:probable HAF family extracellular repeat protein
MKRIAILLNLTLICVAAATTTSAATFQIVNLGTLGGATSFALDVNNNRQVTGNSLVTSDPGSTGSLLRAYCWSFDTGVMTNLGAMAPIPPSTSTNRFARGYAINDSGVIVGEFNNDASRAFIYTGGAMVGLTRLTGDNDSGVAQDINNVGDIVGVSSNGVAGRPTQWSFDGTNYVAIDLGSIDGTMTTSGRANAINQLGAAAGFSRDAVASTSQATLWSGGTVTDLGSLGDGNRCSQALGLNDSNVVVGSSSTGQTVGQLIGTSSTTSITRAFQWNTGVITELSPFNLYGPGNTGPTTNYHSVAIDINNTGSIVGTSQRIAGSPAVATLWKNGVPIDLNTLIPAGSGWNLLSAEGINERGDIVGFGTFQGSNRAFLLTIPEPTSVVSLIVGICLFGRSAMPNS